MINAMVRDWARGMLRLRYRIRIKGLKEVAARGTRGILFLPNHPALIDPIILMAELNKTFHPRALADKDQIDRFFIRWCAKRMNVHPMSDLGKYGPSAMQEVRQAISTCASWLRAGDNLLLYPAGQVYRQYREDIGAKSAVETLLQEIPDVRVVLIRTRGLWGSSFGYAGGKVPSVGAALGRGIPKLLASGVFFAPKREVSIELVEPTDLPRTGGKAAINRYLEEFYNQDALPNTYVPYTPWEKGGVRHLPEPKIARLEGSIESVPASTRQVVTDYLKQSTGVSAMKDEDRLAHDLGMDSLSRADLIVWLEKEFGFPQGNPDALQTVSDVLLAACGVTSSSHGNELKPVPARWFAPDADSRRLPGPSEPTIAAAFLARAREMPGKAIVADQSSGAKTYRDLVLGVMVLKREIEKLPGERVGIMLPASVGADVVYLAAMFAGKTPVMVNWTSGQRNVSHSLDLVGVKHVLTAQALVGRVESLGIDLKLLKDRFCYLETISAGLSRLAKLRAFLASRLCWAALDRAKISPTAVVLFTSGSEALPKAVPLSHSNVLTNIRDGLSFIEVRQNDRMMSMLPPFHSFGLTVGMAVPLCCGVQAVHFANPTDGAAVGRHIDAYKASVVVGTPTFLNGIVRASSAEQLASLRMAITGAEKCTDRVYEALEQRCPQMMVLEGYGITECSPMVAANTDRGPIKGAIGKVLPSLEHVLVSPETHQAVPPGQTGLLLVRGPTVFDGYLNFDGPSPFMEYGGRTWYCTGDLVSEDAQGVLTFRGRLKRFVKLGGEMISLPAIESVLESAYSQPTDEGPTLAVEATPQDEHPEIVLFTVRPIDREDANRRLRAAGLSGLHNIRRVIPVEQIPLLGTGKTDYRVLKERLKTEAVP